MSNAITRATKLIAWRTGIISLLLIGFLLNSSVAATTGNQATEFNHDQTGFLLNGAHQRLRCDSCHAKGVFKGTPRRCQYCHSQSSKLATIKKSSNHIQSTNNCDDCHTEVTWTSVRVDHSAVIGSCVTCHNGTKGQGKPANHVQSHDRCDSCHRTITWSPAFFDHDNVTGSCFNCHNGSTATGKHPQHIQSSNQCDDCHRTTAWRPAGFDHSNVTGACSTCHNGTTATGKPAQHIQSSNICEDCHRTTSWIPAIFDHSNITGTCYSCHNGTTAPGKPNNHIQSSNQCEDCHSTTAWTPAGFDHSNAAGSCSTCHNGLNATGKPNDHFITALQCDECHNTTVWNPADFRHTSPNYPGDHRASLSCISCHSGNSETVNWPSPSYKPDCAGCHANNFKQDSHKKSEEPPPLQLYTVDELRDCSGSCHFYKNGVIEKARTGEHSTTDGGW